MPRQKKNDSEKSLSWARPPGLEDRNFEISGVKGKFSTDQLYFRKLGELSGESITFGEATVVGSGFEGAAGIYGQPDPSKHNGGNCQGKV